MHILFRPIGTKIWHKKYRYNGKEKLLIHGEKPFITLAEARKLRSETLALFDKDVEPAKEKRIAKAKKSNKFWNLAKEWFDNNCLVLQIG